MLNCPSDPAAVITPKAQERRSSGKTRPARARLRHADQQPGAEMKIQRRGGRRHDVKAHRIKHAAAGDHLAGTEAIGDGPGQGLEGAPKQILQRHAEGEDLAAPAQVRCHGP